MFSFPIGEFRVWLSIRGRENKNVSVEVEILLFLRSTEWNKKKRGDKFDNCLRDKIYFRPVLNFGVFDRDLSKRRWRLSNMIYWFYYNFLQNFDGGRSRLESTVIWQRSKDINWERKKARNLCEILPKKTFVANNNSAAGICKDKRVFPSF